MDIIKKCLPFFSCFTMLLNQLREYVIIHYFGWFLFVCLFGQFGCCLIVSNFDFEKEERRSWEYVAITVHEAIQLLFVVLRKKTILSSCTGQIFETSHDDNPLWALQFHISFSNLVFISTLIVSKLSICSFFSFFFFFNIFSLLLIWNNLQTIMFSACMLI